MSSIIASLDALRRIAAEMKQPPETKAGAPSAPKCRRMPEDLQNPTTLAALADSWVQIAKDIEAGETEPSLMRALAGRLLDDMAKGNHLCAFPQVAKVVDGRGCVAYLRRLAFALGVPWRGDTDTQALKGLAVVVRAICRAGSMSGKDIWLTVASAAKKAKVTDGVISRACTNGRIHCVGKGRGRQVQLASFEVWKENRQRKAEIAAMDGKDTTPTETSLPKLPVSSGLCHECGHTVTLKKNAGRCPKCGNESFELLNSPSASLRNRR